MCCKCKCNPSDDQAPFIDGFGNVIGNVVTLTSPSIVSDYIFLGTNSFPCWLAQKILDYHTIPGGEYRHKYGTHGTSIIDDLKRELER
jgi:hypothetical protein